MRASLSRQRVRLSEKVVLRLMKQECLVVAKPKRRRYGSYLGEISPAPENLVNRDFTAVAPNEKWLTDFTEFLIPAGKVYLSPIIDCFDGKVISWSIGTRPDAELVNTMLDAAVETVARNSKRPVVHSDRGAHYRWPGWLSRIADAKLIRSRSRKGCSPDNAACEGFFGRLKTELFCPRNWQSTSIEQFILALDSYIRWYNEKRIKISLGALSPIEVAMQIFFGNTPGSLSQWIRAGFPVTPAPDRNRSAPLAAQPEATARSSLGLKPAPAV
jgi:putative transposase